MATASGSPSSRVAPRAPRGLRRGARSGLRPDRDGDLTMDVAVKGRGRIGKATPSPAPGRDLTARPSRGGVRGGSLLSHKSRSAIARHVALNDAGMKGARTTVPRGGLVELAITGWEKSKASSDKDGGVSSLIRWLEKKASHRLGSRTREVRIKKSRVEESTLIISVPPEDVAALVRMDGYAWAGTSVTIKRIGEGQDAGSSSATEDTKAKLKRILEGRYNAETQLLDLSALGQDTELQKMNVFDKKSTTSKIFPALMKVLELAFDTPAEKDAAILSVSLANNELNEISTVTTLSITLPKLHNLDLSNNKIERFSTLEPWRRRFPALQHLVISGNPIEQAEPQYASELMKWFPNLRLLNSVQVRTEEDIAQQNTTTDLPFPIRSALFDDQGGIAENFVRTFFVGFDTDRAALAAHYYDDNSDFSYAVNTQAPRDPAASETTEKQEWDQYIHHSRNLKKITHLPARMSRMFRGTTAVSEAFAAMPKTRHPDLSAEARKWCIEAHMQPGVPDPTGQSSSGVDGFMITVHGEFEELDPATGQAKKRRSFDRTFVIGPGSGPSGVRVVNDILTIRAYGGAQAFEPDVPERALPATAAETIDPAVPQLPANVSLEMAEQMVLELQKQTSLTVLFAKECLEAAGWEFQRAVESFESVKGSLGPEAFVVVGS